MNEIGGYDIEDLRVGMTATFDKLITDADIILFAEASGDNNAVHLDECYAQTTRFKGRVAHGMLTASVISAAIATRLPGPGSIYIAQNLRFLSPVKPGATVRATITIKDVDFRARRVTLSTVSTVDCKVVIEGDALVMPTTRQGARAIRGASEGAVKSSVCL
jgi:3-hydroxybutyryl-CoA dehydratase